MIIYTRRRHDASVHFDTGLPLHATAGGVLKGPKDLCPGLESSSTPTFIYPISNMAQSFGLTVQNYLFLA